MPAEEYGRSLQGLGINLLVRDVTRSVAFARDVLGASVAYADKDFAVLRYANGPTRAEWMLHSDGTYHSNPLLGLIGDAQVRGVGAEITALPLRPRRRGRARQGAWPSCAVGSGRQAARLARILYPGPRRLLLGAGGAQEAGLTPCASLETHGLVRDSCVHARGHAAGDLARAERRSDCHDRVIVGPRRRVCQHCRLLYRILCAWRFVDIGHLDHPGEFRDSVCGREISWRRVFVLDRDQVAGCGVQRLGTDRNDRASEKAAHSRQGLCRRVPDERIEPQSVDVLSRRYSRISSR